ncbi:MAG: tetratricopeptide repeat protein [Opitutaceae bacterium]|jgi:hypothetical protein
MKKAFTSLALFFESISVWWNNDSTDKLRKSAEQGDDVAQCNLGSAYASGRGVPKDLVEAVKWYRKAAEQGYAQAQFNFGVVYAKGVGVTQDFVEAHAWWNVAGAGGYENAQRIVI